MNGSFEAASHLERAIRAGLEDQSDSSLSAPGLARRAKSASLSFATDQGSDDGNTGDHSYAHPSTNRILDHLSEYDATTAFAGKTPTATRMVTAVQDLPPSRASQSQSLTSRSQQQQRRPFSSPSSALTTSRKSSRLVNATSALPQQDDQYSPEDDAEHSKVADSRSSSLSSSESGMRTTARDASRKSAPLTSTPNRNSTGPIRSRDTTGFYTQRSNPESILPRPNLAKRAAQAAARDATTQSEATGSRFSRTLWSPAGEDGHHVGAMPVEEDLTALSDVAHADERELSVNTIEQADSIGHSRQAEDSENSRDISLGDHTEGDSLGQTSQMHTSDIRPSHTAEPESDRLQVDQARSISAEGMQDSVDATAEATHDSAPETSPSAARAARQAIPPHPPSTSRAPFSSAQSMVTPRPQADNQRMQTYLLSVIKDPAREEKIQKSVKRMRAQRVPIEELISEESSADGRGPHSPVTLSSTPQSSGVATPFMHRMDRLGRPMILGAGRTPLPPFRSSGLANQYPADDSRSQASDQSSVHDLVGPNRWENKSEPGTVAREGRMVDSGLRVNADRLDRHLHRVNAELAKENDRLADENAAKQGEVEALRRQLNTALREKEMLTRQTDSDGQMSPANVPLPPSPIPDSPIRLAEHNQPEQYESTLAAVQQKVVELEGHKEQLNDMLDDLEEQFAQLQMENEKLKKGKASSQSRDDSRRDQTAHIDKGEEEPHQQLEQAMRELDELDQECQAKEQELQALDQELQAKDRDAERLQGLFEEAKQFALQEVENAEAARDRAQQDAADSQRKVTELQNRVDELNANIAHLHSDEADSRSDPPKEEGKELREQVAQLQKQLETARQELKSAQEEHINIRDELEAALESGELQLQDLEREKALADEDLRLAAEEESRIKDELDHQKIIISEKDNEILQLRRKADSLGSANHRLAELEAALDSARREVAVSKDRLATMMTKSEHDKEVKIRQEEIEFLRKQKVEVEARLEDYKQQASSISTSLGGGGQANSSLKTPAKGMHKALLNLRTPIRTPQSPGQLSGASWLNESTIGNESAILHIQELQRMLDEANVKIDEKLIEIDRQGLSHLTLTKRLLEAHGRIEELEAEMARLLGEGGRLQSMESRLRKIRCTACKTGFDATKQVRVDFSSDNYVDDDDQSTADETVTSHTIEQNGRTMAKSSRSRQRDQALADFVAKVPILTARLAQVESENRKLREATSREAAARGETAPSSTRNVNESARSKDVVKQNATQFSTEIENARAAIEDLELELQEERKRLPNLTRDSKVFGDLTFNAERDLARTGLRLRSIEAELKRKADDHAQLYRELLDKSSVEEDVPLQLQVLQAQVRQTAMDVEHLREDKNSILEAREELHERFRSASEKYLTVQSELNTCRQAVSLHANQLDEQSEKMKRLHLTLKEQQRTVQRVTGERDRLSTQREDIINDVSSLEADLRRVRLESQAFGKDLERLRRERDDQRRRAEVARETSVSITAEAQETIKVLKERLDEARRMIRQVELSSHPLDDRDLQALKLKHERECKGLLLHTRYLKTKFMRESDLRADLAFQKRYLLQILGGLEMSEAETVKFLSDLDRSRKLPEVSSRSANGPTSSIGIATSLRRGAGAGGGGSRTSSSVSNGHKLLKKAATAVRVVVRMSLMAQRWRETRKVKEALLQAHQTNKQARIMGKMINAHAPGVRRNYGDDDDEEEGEGKEGGRVLYRRVAT